MVQATFEDTKGGEREITAVGRSGVSVGSGKDGAVNVAVEDRTLVVEKCRLVVDGDAVASIEPNVRRIDIINRRRGLEVNTDGKPLWSER